MAKTKISEYDSTAANNTDIDSINIAEGMAPSNVNNAIRELMAHLKDGLGAGTPVFLDQTNNRLGVGTTTPESGLHLFDGTNVGSPQNSSRKATLTIEAGSEGSADIQFLNASYNHLFFGDAADANIGYQVYDHTNNSLQFGVNAAERMRIDSSGNIGIGTTSPNSSYKMTIESTASEAGIRVQGDSARIACFENGSATIGDGPNFYMQNVSGGTYAASMQMGASSEILFFQYPNSGAWNERMRIDSSGNVGIGTSSPAAKIHASIPSVANTSTEIFRLSDEVLCDFKVFLNRSATLGNSVSALNTASGIMAFETSNTERFRVTSNQVLIGAASSVGSSLAGLELSGTQGNNHIKSAVTLTSGYDAVVFINGNGIVGRITTAGSGTTYSTSSDYRLKENVTDVTDGITRLKQLSPKRFNFIADADTILDGFLAHEAQAVVPEAVTGTKDAVQVWAEGEELPDGVSVGDNKLDDNGNTIIEPQGIDQAKLVPLLTAALQEAIAKIEELETRVAALEG